MKNVLCIGGLLLFGALRGFAQDKVTLINGDQLNAKVIKRTASVITIAEGGIEREIDTDFVREIVTASSAGESRAITITPSFSLGFENDVELVVVSGMTVDEECRYTFPNAIRRQFRITQSRLFADRADELFVRTRKENLSEMPEEEVQALNVLRFYAYICNAFLAVVNTKNGVTDVSLYSSPISKETITAKIVNKKFRLIESKVFDIGDTYLEILLKPFVVQKPFTMQFAPNGECSFKEDKRQAQLLSYEVTSRGEIFFWEGNAKDRATIYDVVFISDSLMRYTRFPKKETVKTEYISRTVQVIE